MNHKHYFETKRTARYFSRHLLNEQTQHIWILIHGYAQTAEHLLQSFEGLDETHFLIAPEGLNRMYSRGFSGTPVANWMTSMEREHEIKDYLHYLDSLYYHLHLYKYPQAKIHLLGFSQGVATASRWLAYTAHRFDTFLMVAGNVANEMHENLPSIMQTIPSIFVIGNKDKLITQERVDSLKSILEPHTPFYTFEGGHEVNEPCVELLKSFVLKAK